jgi:hypothetical protein
VRMADAKYPADSPSCDLRHSGRTRSKSNAQNDLGAVR